MKEAAAAVVGSLVRGPRVSRWRKRVLGNVKKDPERTESGDDEENEDGPGGTKENNHST